MTRDECVGFADCPCRRCRETRIAATARHGGHLVGDAAYCRRCWQDDRERHDTRRAT